MLTPLILQTIAAVAVALKQVNTQAFRDYAAQIIANTKVRFARRLPPLSRYLRLLLTTDHRQGPLLARLQASDRRLGQPPRPLGSSSPRPLGIQD